MLIYIPYLIAEALEMSGIVATLFAGISVKHYVASNLTVESQQKVRLVSWCLGEGLQGGVGRVM